MGQVLSPQLPIRVIIRWECFCHMLNRLAKYIHGVHSFVDSDSIPARVTAVLGKDIEFVSGTVAVNMDLRLLRLPGVITFAPHFLARAPLSCTRASRIGNTSCGCNKRLWLGNRLRYSLEQASILRERQSVQISLVRPKADVYYDSPGCSTNMNPTITAGKEGRLLSPYKRQCNLEIFP